MICYTLYPSKFTPHPTPPHEILSIINNWSGICNYNTWYLATCIIVHLMSEFNIDFLSNQVYNIIDNPVTHAAIVLCSLFYTMQRNRNITLSSSRWWCFLEYNKPSYWHRSVVCLEVVAWLHIVDSGKKSVYKTTRYWWEMVSFARIHLPSKQYTLVEEGRARKGSKIPMQEHDNQRGEEFIFEGGFFSGG